jgi:Fungal specific transcription factor domain
MRREEPQIYRRFIRTNNTRIDAFFTNISSWVPLFHRPNFYNKYDVHGVNLDRYQNLQLEDCLVISGICALAARFSTSTYFDIAPKSRAEPFLRRATELYQDAIKSDRVTCPNLSLLQGLLLLGWFHQVCGSSDRCWVLIGVCCRLAYDLGLNNTDQDILESKTSAQWSSTEEWSKREERRRAWWFLWELDMFSSTVLHLPHTIEKTQIDVLLPVSDIIWFTDSPVASVPIMTDPIYVWKSLKDSPNQNEKAWFIVSVFLRAVAHDLTRKRETRAQAISDFQSSLICFAILLPKEFDLQENLINFDDNNFGACNWIISTQMMILSSVSTDSLIAAQSLCCRLTNFA